ncbi:MAG TPA: CRISPR-associated endonuclease Cas2 [Rhodospirillales bacterium]|nr:CRISPR-associated endonuclease Cas2 [Rhodospirillales bacterium]|tara:strand:- start:815 stop:1102 length:288 start_codon:yes stop_codon:yes gene_type:complete
MAATEMVMIFCYDITERGNRAQVSGILEDSGVRVQKSVFESRLTRKAADALFQRLSAFIEKGDSLRMYALSNSGLARSRIEGGAPLPEKGEFWIV